MNFLKRIAESKYVKTRFRWPSARTLRLYWCIIALVALLSSVDVINSVYKHAISTGLPHASGTALLAGLADLVAWGLIGVVFFIMWGLYYRMGTEIAAGFRSFRAWLPGAWQSMGRGAAAVVIAVRRIPALIGSFFRGIWQALLWIAGRPAWWRGLTRKQKLGVISGWIFTGAYLATLVLFYPVAHRISAACPSWMIMSDAPLLQTLFFDIFLGSLIASFGIAILSTVVSVVAHIFSKR